MNDGLSRTRPNFGSCPSCRLEPDSLGFGRYIYWARCVTCCKAWWVQFSSDGWNVPEAAIETVESSLIGWDISAEQQHAFEAGAAAEAEVVRFLSEALGPFKPPTEATIHVRTCRFEPAFLLITDEDPDDDIYVVVAAGRGRCSVSTWVYGHQAKQQREFIGGWPA